MSALNADGVYFATYYSLVLNLKLVTCGYYHSEEKSLPITQVYHFEISLKLMDVF